MLIVHALEFIARAGVQHLQCLRLEHPRLRVVLRREVAAGSLAGLAIGRDGFFAVAAENVVAAVGQLTERAFLKRLHINADAFKL